VAGSFGFTSLDKKLDIFARELSGKPAKARVEAVARSLAPLVEKAAQGDLGDNSMSGWRRGNPIAITGVVRVDTKDVAIEPGKRAKGPMRVLETGRHFGESGGFQGPGVNRKTGETARTKAGKVRKVRARKSSRWNGHTQPRGTWTKAEEHIAAAYPPAMAAQVDDVMFSLFLKG